ncbi:MAG: hypothetical protein A2096_02380 [Spirochaetes bacterium GWF1_41_5]|nr:MAG: hypothetical protein A2096_02380 [Spirochaetes bacterium GWF1_41_5]HBE02751.1 hypothetical protein [Spirochaetia bacterium]
MLKFVLFSLIAVNIFSTDFPLLDFKQAWVLPEGAKIENDTLVINGNPGEYLRANLAVPADAFGSKPFYIIGEIKIFNVKPGKASYHAPKFKIIDKDNPQFYIANNISAGGSFSEWTPYSLKCTLKPEYQTRTLLIEIAMQECEGTFFIRNLAFSLNPPEVKYVFPFALPVDPVCRLEINTRNKTPFNNNLLGCNEQFTGDPEFGYDQERIENIISATRLPLLRFPGGTVANWYNWETDMFKMLPGDSKPPHGDLQKKFGYPDYERICKKYHITSIQVFNILFDTPEYSAKRLEFLKKSGLVIPWIELGNENYAEKQQSKEVNSVATYMEKCKQVTATLKSIDKNILCAVNIENPNSENWTLPLSKEKFYDAVVIHPYIYIGVKDKELDLNTSRIMLSSYSMLYKELTDCEKIFNGRPFLLSEWGLLAPPQISFNMLGALGTADMFNAIIEFSEKGMVKMASIHILFGGFMGLYHHQDGNINKRPYAFMFDLMIKSFLDSELFQAHSAGPMLADNLPAVQAKAAIGKDQVIRVYAVNKTPAETRLDLLLDGKKFSGNFTRFTYAEKDPAAVMIYPLAADAVTASREKGLIRLPPYSINCVELR